MVPPGRPSGKIQEQQGTVRGLPNGFSSRDQPTTRAIHRDPGICEKQIPGRKIPGWRWIVTALDWLLEQGRARAVSSTAKPPGTAGGLGCLSPLTGNLRKPINLQTLLPSTPNRNGRKEAEPDSQWLVVHGQLLQTVIRIVPCQLQRIQQTNTGPAIHPETGEAGDRNQP